MVVAHTRTHTHTRPSLALREFRLSWGPNVKLQLGLEEGVNILLRKVTRCLPGGSGSELRSEGGVGVA